MGLGVRLGLAAVSGTMLAGGMAAAQMHKVARPETVVRAVGVYEWTGDLAKPKGERLVPVTIFIDGKMEDAGVYLSRPIPMALGPGTIYELDEAGVERGLLDVKMARHVQIPAAADLAPYDEGWFGYGSFAAPPVPKAPTVKKATQQVAVNGKVPAVGDGPHFSGKGGDAKDAAGDGNAPAAGSPEDVKVDGGADSKNDKDDVDRPTLRRRPAMDPKEAKKARKERDESSVTGEPTSLNADPDRPTMKRHEGPTVDDLPALNGLPADMRQMVAVSDAKRREPHPFARPWEDEAEHQAVLGKMRAMAMAQILAYGPVPAGTGAANAGSSGSAAEAGTTGGARSGSAAGAAQDTTAGTPPVLRHNRVATTAPANEQVTADGGTAASATAPSAAGKPPAKAAAPALRGRSNLRHGRTPDSVPAAGDVLVDESVRGFLLSYGGAATYVYTAHTAGTGAALRYVTVVAQADGISGELKMAMHGVTDAAHLDRQPWMRFVDVVDVEASNRASLMFELRGQTSRQFALYRVIGAKADTLFMGGTTQ